MDTSASQAPVALELPLFAPAAERAMVRAYAESAQSGLDPNAWVWLAWTEREADPPASEAWANRAQLALQRGWQAPLGTAARLKLLAVELGLRQAHVEQARLLTPQILQQFESLEDQVGQMDAHCLLGRLYEQQGEGALKSHHLTRAIQLAHSAGDERRRWQFEADQARTECFVNLVQAEGIWRSRIPASISALSSEVAAAISGFWSVLHGNKAEYAECLSWLRINFEKSVDSGQVRRAIVAASNLGLILTQMNAHEEALHWLQQGLAIARPSGWSGPLGGLLINLAGVLHQLRQLDPAREAVQEALTHLAKVPPGRNHVTAYNMLGRIELDAGNPKLALAAYEAMHANTFMQQADLSVIGGIGLVKALLALQRYDEGLDRIAATLALARAQSNQQYVVEALGVRADLLAAQNWPDAPAAYNEALEAAAALKNYRPEASLLEAASHAHARAGLLERAYELSCQVNTTRAENFSAETAKAMTGLRAQHQMERTEAENLLLRERAGMNAARASLLEDHLQLLIRLSSIGQEIATAIESDGVHEVLTQQVRQLLKPGAMAIATPDAKGEWLVTRHSHCDEGALRLVPLSLQDSNDPRAVALRERRECSEASPNAAAHEWHMPLCVGERGYGVLSVWGVEGQPQFGERELLVLRMLATYGAIALANAEAYERLSTLKQHLMQQERHAALGAMVAGVAHELNTPIGNALLVASTLAGQMQAFEQRLAGAEPLRRSELRDTIAGQREGLQVIERSMHTAARLVGSFKQVAVDRASESRGRFRIADLCRDCEATMGIAMRNAEIEMHLDVPQDVVLDSYPGALGQVLVVLINNALLHAFDGPRIAALRQISIKALASEGGVRLLVEDNGIGMSQSVQRRIFEPFFTTKFGRGGSGLGLTIANNLVASVLGGSMRVESQLQVGSCFTLTLPLSAPA